MTKYIVRTWVTATVEAGVMHPYNYRRNYTHHAFEAIQIEVHGGEALLHTFRVTQRRTPDAAYRAAERLCADARRLAHKPAAFVREINAP